MDFVSLLAGSISAVLPHIANSIGVVKPPKPVNIEKAFQEARTCRPIVPYHVSKPYAGGRVKALFIGINYKGTKSQLSGCVNDVRYMLTTLQRIQFPITHCCILVDDHQFPGVSGMPTRANIIRHMAWLVDDVRPGDVLFFHYSGHGTQAKGGRDSHEKCDQCLVPLDYDREGAILDDDLFKLLISRLPYGVRMTALFDCCHSASMLDLPFVFVGDKNYMFDGRQQMRQVRQNNFSYGDVVMISGCEDNDTSDDVQNTSSFGTGCVAAGGAATQALIWALTNTSKLSYGDIFVQTREVLRKKGYKQVPQLSSSKPIDLRKPFSLFGSITPNQSQMGGVPQQYQQPRPYMPTQHQHNHYHQHAHYHHHHHQQHHH